MFPHAGCRHPAVAHRAGGSQREGPDCLTHLPHRGAAWLLPPAAPLPPETSVARSLSVQRSLSVRRLPQPRWPLPACCWLEPQSRGDADAIAQVPPRRLTR